ncbi:aspartyl-phosphate phosphatase Spo0E family protein [Clostridium sp. 'White wine YQ']|uniref:aspartyl-phosphate phosphatase Spo0E family protein n=1 Tax=Clostridium sp. 'White wine YQ' TaxID=3027474 RepID=UPI002366A91C|nr:aspartyl-phosphate phosphatase Spo0E family protein [Clostridium sp. 'White wine YQ']MDD7793204.1 aspartyl-phosphate phosphatase Spo0E family protein [Clostridium sp. 'White wine YQ']
MSNLEEVLVAIEDLRSQMINLLDEKDEIFDPELVEVSQLLDSKLNDYEAIIRQTDDA